MSSTAKIGISAEWDGSKLNSGVDGAKQKVGSLDQKVKGFGLSMGSLQKAFGIGFAVAAVSKMVGAIKDVVALSEKGIKIVSDSDLASMKQINALLDEFGNKAKGAGAIISEYMVGGLIAFGYTVKNVAKEIDWKKIIFNNLPGAISEAKRAMGVGGEKGTAEAGKAMREAQSNAEKEKTVGAVKKADETKEKLRQAGLSDQEKLLESEQKMLKAAREYANEKKNGGKDTRFMAEQETIMAEESMKQMELRDKIAEAEKKIADQTAKQNKARAESIEKHKQGEQEIADIRKKGLEVGASLEEKLALNKQAQAEKAKEVAREGGEKGQKKRAEFAELVNEQKQIELDIRKNQKKKKDIVEEARKDVAKLTDTKTKEVSSKALGGASMGMYLGGTDRSGVAIKSKAEAIAEKTKDILERMAKDISELNGGGV